jgi:stearoyl-CoA desaturase (delta-9 desaturase)
VNSACHLWGTRRYATTDRSKNNWWAALLTLGEGWHNNHHHYQSCARQGFRWWEVDVSYYVLKALSWLRLVSDLRMPSESVKYAHLKYTEEEREALRRGGLVLKPTGRLLERHPAHGVGARVREAIAAASEALPPGRGAPALD